MAHWVMAQHKICWLWKQFLPFSIADAVAGQVSLKAKTIYNLRAEMNKY
jgi:hypothetical protein